MHCDWLLASLLGALVFGWFLSPRGVKAKLSYILGLKLPDVSNRVVFVPRRMDRKTDVLIVSFAGGELLCCLFLCEGALQIGGHSQPEFQKTLSELEADQLFLLDPSGMSWYLADSRGGHNGLPEIESVLKVQVMLIAYNLKEHLQGYKAAVFIGNCMGASGALMFSHLARKVVCFNPHICPKKFSGTSCALGKLLIWFLRIRTPIFTTRV